MCGLGAGHERVLQAPDDQSGILVEHGHIVRKQVLLRLLLPLWSPFYAGCISTTIGCGTSHNVEEDLGGWTTWNVG